MCILIGPAKVGKTSFLLKLQNDELISVKQSEKNKDNPNVQDYIVLLKSKPLEIKIHELNCRLNSYLSKFRDNSKAILYMIDSTNRIQISEAFICLLETLKNKQFSDIPVLILLNKCDEIEAMTRHEVELFFHMKDVIKCTSLQNINQKDTKMEMDKINSESGMKQQQNRLVNVIECSSLNGTGLQHALSWLLNVYSTCK